MHRIAHVTRQKYEYKVPKGDKLHWNGTIFVASVQAGTSPPGAEFVHVEWTLINTEVDFIQMPLQGSGAFLCYCYAIAQISVFSNLVFLDPNFTCFVLTLNFASFCCQIALWV